MPHTPPTDLHPTHVVVLHQDGPDSTPEVLAWWPLYGPDAWEEAAAWTAAEALAAQGYANRAGYARHVQGNTWSV